MNLPTITLPKLGNPALAAKITGFAAPIAAMAVSVIVIAFIVWPKFSDVMRLRTENKQLEMRATSLEAKAQKLATYDKDVLDKQLVAAEQLMPSDKGIFSIASRVERAAAASGVLLSSIEVVAPGQATAQKTPSASEGSATPAPAASPAPASSTASQTAGGESKVQLRVSVSSDYKSFLQFLSNILAIPRVVTIADLGLAAGGTSGASSQLKTGLVIDAYYLPLPRELSSIETPIEDLTAGEVELLNKVESGEAPVVVPAVPVGRSDLFASF